MSEYYFVKDLVAPYGCSKFNLLATMCAQVWHEVKFFTKECGCTVAVQCGDGRMVLPTGYENMRRTVILHDWDEKYRVAIDGAHAIITIGDYTWPEFNTRIVRSVPSFPLYTPMLDAYAGQWDHFDTVIGGRLDVNSMERYRANSFRVHGRIAFIPFTDDESRGKDLADEIYSDAKHRGDITRMVDTNLMVARMLYATCNNIVHLGAGRGGFMSSIARYMSRGIYPEQESNFTLTTVESFARLLQGTR